MKTARLLLVGCATVLLLFLTSQGYGVTLQWRFDTTRDGSGNCTGGVCLGTLRKRNNFGPFYYQRSSYGFYQGEPMNTVN